MKNVFKKMFVTMALALAFSGAAYADKDTPITLKQLPTRAQILLRSNFKGKKVSFSKKDSDLFGRSYDVIFTNGDKVEFDRDGNWKSISCRRGRRVPAGLVPSSILRHVRNRYRSVYIVDIDREKNKYEVELSNGMELTFNKHGKLIEVDD